MSRMKARNEADFPFVVAVDFDGTLTMGHDWEAPFELDPEAVETLIRLHEKGIDVVLWTSRYGAALRDACGFLFAEADRLRGCGTMAALERLHLITSLAGAPNRTPNGLESYLMDAGRKLIADYYIDDRSVPGGRIDWPKTEAWILELYARYHAACRAYKAQGGLLGNNGDEDNHRCTTGRYDIDDHAQRKGTGMKRLLWAWKALPMQTRRKRFADEVWFWLYGDEADADAWMD